MSGTDLHGHSFSADVRMQLDVSGRTLAIAQLGPDFIILREPIDHPPAEGEISVWIDGDLTRWPIRLPEGIATTQVRTPTAYRWCDANGSAGETAVGQRRRFFNAADASRPSRRSR